MKSSIIKMISPYNNSSRNGSPINYIVCHYTGNTQDTAVANAKYFNECDRKASAHYFVDDNSIYQVVEDHRSSWAVGDGAGRYGITNSNSISIEMCTSGNSTVSTATELNCARLVRSLMKTYNISIDNVVRHYDASRKICPNWQGSNWSRWSDFKTNTLSTVGQSDGKWIEDKEGWWYKLPSASYNGKDYYYDCWKKIDGDWYLFGTSGPGGRCSGCALRCSGPAWADGRTYSACRSSGVSSDKRSPSWWACWRSG